MRLPDITPFSVWGPQEIESRPTLETEQVSSRDLKNIAMQISYKATLVIFNVGLLVTDTAIKEITYNQSIDSSNNTIRPYFLIYSAILGTISALVADFFSDSLPIKQRTVMNAAIITTPYVVAKMVGDWTCLSSATSIAACQMTSTHIAQGFGSLLPMVGLKAYFEWIKLKREI